MATTKTTPAPRQRRVAPQPDAIASRAIAGATESDGDESTVRVMVPNAFRLTDDGHTIHDYAAGEQDMPASHAAHRWSLLNGVTAA